MRNTDDRWGNLDIELAPVPRNTPDQVRAAQLTVCRCAPDREAAVELLEALGIRERVTA